MSFVIELHTNNSDNRMLTKSTTLVKSLSGTMKDETSVVNPTILIEGSATDILKCNYLIIPDFSRKYFITNIKNVRNNLWELTCHVDVLSSFASDIRANEAIIKRQESKWNLYLNDNSIKTYQNPHVVTKEFPAGFSTDSMSYILLVAGRPVDGWFDDSNTEV